MNSPDTPSSPAAEPQRPRGGRRSWVWVPIRALRERHRARIERHLLQLSARDRYLRFGFPASDEHIHRYVESLDFRRDEIFGIFNRRLQLVAMAHIAYGEQPGLGPRSETPMAEFAVSVLASARGRGLGARMFGQAMIHARNRHTNRLLIHALCENTAMLRIARNAGATIEHEGVEADAWVTLPPESLGSHLEEIVSTQAAELGYGLRLRWLQFRRAVSR